MHSNQDHIIGIFARFRKRRGLFKVQLASNRDPVLIVCILLSTAKQPKQQPCLYELVSVDCRAQRVDERVEDVLLFLNHLNAV